MFRYMEVCQRNLADPDGFWGEAAKAIDWFTPPATVLDGSSPPFYRWFSSGRGHEHARIGVVHSVVFGGFAPHEPAIRIEDPAVLDALRPVLRRGGCGFRLQNCPAPGSGSGRPGAGQYALSRREVAFIGRTGPRRQGKPSDVRPGC
jgi:hypothetical protein